MKKAIFLLIAAVTIGCNPIIEDLPTIAAESASYTLILDKDGNVTNPLDHYPESLKIFIQDHDGNVYEVMNRTYCSPSGNCTTTKTDDFCGISFVGRRGIRHLTLSGCKGNPDN